MKKSKAMPILAEKRVVQISKLNRTLVQVKVGNCWFSGGLASKKYCPSDPKHAYGVYS